MWFQNTNLAGHGVGFTDLVTPVASTHRNNGQLGQDDSPTDGGGHFLAALDTQPDVAVAVTDGDEGLEARTLTGTGLLLDGHDLQHFVLQRAAQEEIDDLELFNGQRVQVDLLQGADLAIAHQATQLGHWNPFLRVFLATATASTATTPSATSASTTATAAARTKSSSKSTTLGWSCVRHSERSEILRLVTNFVLLFRNFELR